MKLTDQQFSELLQCVSCGAGPIEPGGSAGEFVCKACGAVYPSRDGIPVLAVGDVGDQESAAPASVDEKLDEATGRFTQSRFYNVEKWILDRVNPKDHMDVAGYVAGQSVLDIGCGPSTYDYLPANASAHVGVDVSLPFLHAAAHEYPDSRFALAMADRLPFKDNAFDVVLLLHVLHHVPIDHEKLLAEASRVSRKYVVVYDHLQSGPGLRRVIKKIWWAVADKGFQYNTQSEWDALLSKFKVREQRVTGGYLENIFEFVLEK